MSNNASNRESTSQNIATSASQTTSNIHSNERNIATNIFSIDPSFEPAQNNSSDVIPYCHDTTAFQYYINNNNRVSNSTSNHNVGSFSEQENVGVPEEVHEVGYDINNNLSKGSLA